jgi:hypothetical protein
MGQKLTEDEIQWMIDDDPNCMFDVCCKCGGTERYGVMNGYGTGMDIICTECYRQETNLTDEKIDGFLKQAELLALRDCGNLDKLSGYYANAVILDSDLTIEDNFTIEVTAGVHGIYDDPDIIQYDVVYNRDTKEWEFV